jgi:HEAT repeat protein
MKTLLLLCATAAFAVDPDELIRRVAAYDYGKDPAAVRELEAVVQKSGPALEKSLIAGLSSAQTLAAKDVFCRQLAIVGTDAAVPALDALLLKKDTAEMARYALERIQGARAATALRGALPRTEPAVQTGIVASLGRRKDASSVEAIKPLLSSKDMRLATAAAEAMGSIGTPAARDALLASPNTPGATDALLAIAERSPAAGAAPIYRRLGPAGLQGLARVDPAQAAPLLRSALKSESPHVQAIAVKELARIDLSGLAKQMPEVSPLAQMRILYALAESGKAEYRTIALESVRSESEGVRIAAVTSLGKLGTAGDLALLASRAATASGDEQSAARAALFAIQGAAADAAILEAIPGAEPKTKVELIRAAGERGIPSSPTPLLAAAADADRQVRTESIRALRETAGPQHVPAMFDLLKNSKVETERREWERTIAAAIRRSKDGAASEGLPQFGAISEPAVKVSLLNVFSATGNPSALPVVRKALDDPAADIRRAALNALSNWPTPEPLDDLLTIARAGGDPARQTLALRGYIRLLQLPSARTPAQTAELLKVAMAAATRPDEKRSVLAIAQKAPSPESLAIARAALEDPQVKAEAQLAVTTIERGLTFVK